MLRLFSNANYQFIEKRRTAYVLTAVALLICLGFAIFWQVNRGSWLNYGVDFTGGTLMQVKFEQPTQEGDLRAVVEGAVPGTGISRFGGSENEFLIRAPAATTEGANTVELITSALRSRNAPFSVEKTELVGPKVGSELQRKAATAVIISLVATLLYLAVRFEWRFGLAAVIATAHDVFLTMGFISIFQYEVSLTTVAAVLTVLGFSTHDTIIIFDRIREDLKKAGKHFSFIQVMNRAINETLPRTVLTVVTTQVTLLSLAIFGGHAVSGFATIMFVGILMGTYSSIFVASPVLYEIEKRWGTRDKEGKSVTAKAAPSTPSRRGAAGAAV